MKKIFYFIASAIVALGAVACQNDIEESIDAGQQTEGLSIKVTIDDQTRVSLGDLEEGKGRKLTFTEGDVLVVRSGMQAGTNYLFEYTQGEGDVYTFTCTAEGVSALVGTKPYVFYLGGLHEQADVLTVQGVICNTAAESIEGIGMYAGIFSYSSNFGEEDNTITMSTMPLLKFTAEEPVTFSSDWDIFFVDNSCASEYTTTKTGDIYLPIITSSGNDCTVTVTTESGFEKSFTKILDENKIYNLGTIAVPAKMYLAPGVWTADNAWFAARFYNATASVSLAATRSGATEEWVKMTDGDGDGIYECEVAEGFDSVQFYRMDNTKEELSVDSAWNVSAELTIASENYESNDCYYVTDWNSGDTPTPGQWGEDREDETTADVASNWSLCGTFNNWGTTADIAMVSSTVGNLYVAKNVTLAADVEFKVRKDNSFDENYGGGITGLNADSYMNVYYNGSNITITTEGTYDIYFDAIYKLLYLVNTGTSYTSAVYQGENGGANVEVETMPIFLAPDWYTSDDAKLYAYYWYDGGDGNVLLADSDADGYYEGAVPTNITGMKFVRLDPAYDEFGWDDRVWNETGNLAVPTADKNYYYIAYNVWEAKDYVPTEKTTQIYYFPCSSWADASAWFGAKIGDEWLKFEKDTNISDYTVYTLTYSGTALTFDLYRFNPEQTDMKDEENWGKMTGLTIPTTEENCFFTNGWDNAGYWDTLPTVVTTNITVTAYNHTEWAQAYVYAFATPTNDVAWPGVKLTTVSGKQMTATIAVKHFENDKVQFVVNNGQGGEGNQTADSNAYEISPNITFYFTDTLILDEEPSSEANTHLYLTPNANWKKDNARFAAYFFGNGEQWVSMTDSDNDGIYEVEIPSGYPNVIFCRMNPSATANNWNNKWNQTADLTVPTQGPNHYTVKEGTWDKGGGTWSTK